MDYLQFIFTGGGSDLDVFQTAVRSIIIFISALIIIRFAKKRFLTKSSAFDVVLSVILGSILSRTINGSAQLAPTLAAAAVIVLFHWVVSYFIVRFNWFAVLIEGSPNRLISNGKIDYNTLKKSHLKESDLIESLRINGNISNIDEIEESYLESSGKISVVIKNRSK